MGFGQFVLQHKVASGVAAAAVVVGGVGVAAVAPGDSPTLATVTAVVDGDTIDVDYDGASHRVRLLNVDTPETVDPDEAVECLGQESTEFLESLLDEGTEVRLEFDVELYDRYDRELAGVFVGETLVNAEVARAGLGTAVVYEPNERFYDEVRKAEEEARAAGTGLYDADLACTIPGQVAAYEKAVTELEAAVLATADDDLDGWDRHRSTARTVATAGAKLAKLLDGDRGAYPLLPWATQIGDLRTRVDDAQALADEADGTVEQRRQAELDRREAERLAAEEAARKAAEEAARKAAEEEAARVAAEQEAARVAAEQAAREAADREAARAAEQAAPAPSGSAYYKNCTAARSAGAAPVYAGEPGYGRHLDRDGDGVGCE